MRISDWSSDVCSSDLPALEASKFKGGFSDVRSLVRDEDALAQQLERVRVRYIGVIEDDTLTQLVREREQVLCIVNNRLHARAVFQTIRDLPGAQTGRASGRARVCQYV